jgi:hypothetical protein
LGIDGGVEVCSDVGGERDVTSTEGEPGRDMLSVKPEELEPGEGGSSGGGWEGGGRTKWKVREAIWIWELRAICDQKESKKRTKVRTAHPKPPYYRSVTKRYPPRHRFAQ